MTEKDQHRVKSLIDFTVQHGLTKGAAQAADEASRITKLTKLDVRADLLEAQGFAALAAPFRHRARWVTANTPI